MGDTIYVGVGRAVRRFTSREHASVTGVCREWLAAAVVLVDGRWNSVPASSFAAIVPWCHGTELTWRGSASAWSGTSNLCVASRVLVPQPY